MNGTLFALINHAFKVILRHPLVIRDRFIETIIISMLLTWVAVNTSMNGHDHM